MEPDGARVGVWFSTLISAFTFKPQYAVGFATILFAVLVGMVFFIGNRNDGGIDKVAQYESFGDIDLNLPDAPKPSTTPKIVKDHPRKVIRSDNPKVNANALLAGEKSYLNAIASLEKAIVEQSDLSMRPTLRAEYERNLAVVDKAIAETQKQARRNPKDQSAAQLLYASYQSKLDLLNAVSNQNQFYASLR